MQITDTDYKGLLGRAAPNFGCASPTGNLYEFRLKPAAEIITATKLRGTELSKVGFRVKRSGARAVVSVAKI